MLWDNSSQIIQNKMSKIDRSQRKSPQFSVLNEKNELKQLESNVGTMKSRLYLLRQQLQRQKEGVKKNKALTKDTIEKKIQVHKINRYKQKDNSEEQQKLEQLRLRNQSVRLSHHKQLQDIQKAIYLVKLDDARQVKNISNIHKKKIQEMDREFLSNQKQRKKKVQEESSKAKERYVQYMKQKLTNIYTQQAQTIAYIGEQKQKKKKEMKQLEEEEIRMMEQINRYHTKEVETKKQYLAALSLPVKEVAEAMGDFQSKKSQKKMNKSKISIAETQTIDNGGLRLPNTNLNQAKLKLILKQLKKMDNSI